MFGKQFFKFMGKPAAAPTANQNADTKTLVHVVVDSNDKFLYLETSDGDKLVEDQDYEVYIDEETTPDASARGEEAAAPAANDPHAAQVNSNACPDCGGTGLQTPTQMCPTCDGSGQKVA